MKIGIYSRQSRIKEDSVSIETQIQKGIEFAEKNGLEYIIYDEGAGKSAACETFDNRPIMVDMLNAVKEGLITKIWCYNEARISRDENTKIIFKTTLKKANVILYSDCEGKIDFNDLNDELFSGFRTLIAQQAVRTISKNIKDTLLYNVTQGKVGGGLFKSFGYKKADDKTKLLVIDEEEAVIVKEIFQMYISGMGTEKIARVLNEKGIPTKSSKVLKEGLHLTDKYSGKSRMIPKDKLIWVGPVILEIIKNPIYMGQRRYKGNLYPAPKIIESDTWNQAQEQIKLNKNIGGKLKHPYLLNGFINCGVCGCGYRGRTRESRRDHYYYCASKNNAKGSCGNRSINIDYLDEIIWYMITNSNVVTKLAMNEVQKLKNPKFIEELQLERKQLESQIRTEENAKSRTHELCKRGVIGIDEAEIDMAKNNVVIEKYQNRLNDLDSLIQKQNQTIKIINEVEVFQKELVNISQINDFEKRRELVKLFVENITILYDEKEETFIIEIIVRLNTHRESNTFFLGKDEKPNLLNFDPIYDRKVLKKKVLKRVMNTRVQLPPSSKPQHPSSYSSRGQLSLAIKINVKAKKHSNKKTHWLDTDCVKLLNVT